MVQEINRKNIGCRWGIVFVVCCLNLLFSGCAVLEKSAGPDNGAGLYAVGLPSGDDLLGAFAPVFLLEEHQLSYNRIGTPSVRSGKNGEGEIFINPNLATFFVESREFTTGKATYTNLIYRIHFEETPKGLFPFHLSAGKNVGLLIIVTLNDKDQPVLYTSAHTCGCYLAFIPTNYMLLENYPERWQLGGRQSVFGESLPSILEFDKEQAGQEQVYFRIGDSTHRIADVDIRSQGEGRDEVHTAQRALRSSLWQLPFEDGATVSFFELDGPRKGYVKDSGKIFERLLISWWAFDPHVGEDKAYGAASETGTVFYTSLKYWNREASDMWEFADFLEFWGWRM